MAADSMLAIAESSSLRFYGATARFRAFARQQN